MQAIGGVGGTPFNPVRFEGLKLFSRQPEATQADQTGASRGIASRIAQSLFRPKTAPLAPQDTFRLNVPLPSEQPGHVPPEEWGAALRRDMGLEAGPPLPTVAERAPAIGVAAQKKGSKVGRLFSALKPRVASRNAVETAAPTLPPVRPSSPFNVPLPSTGPVVTRASVEAAGLRSTPSLNSVAGLDRGRSEATVSGPVIDPDTGVLHKARLRQVADALVDALPPLPANASSRQARLRGRLLQELQALHQTAADDTRLRPDQLGKAVRDRFAKASKAARVLARSLDGSVRLTRRPREPEAALAYLGVAGLLTELKRTHLSAAAADIMDRYADREIKNLERVAPGISQRVSGPRVNTHQGASLSYGVGGAKAGLGGSSGIELFTDDDLDVDFWTTYGAYIKGGYGGKIAGWAAEVAGKLGVNAGGTFYEKDDLREMVKLITNLHANKSWANSAGPRARRLMGGLQKASKGAARGLLGRNYVPATGSPCYLGDAKIAKGFNRVKMDLLARSLDEQLGGNRFHRLVSVGYPPIESLLSRRLAAGEKLPLPGRRETPMSKPFGDGRFPYRKLELSGSASIGKGTSGHAVLEAVGLFSAGLRGEFRQIFLESANAAHELLDPGYHKDLVSTFRVHQALDKLCAHPPGEMHLYDSVRRAMDPGGRRPALHLSAQDRDHYGDPSTIPAQFVDAIAHPDTDKLQRVARLAQQLTRAYLDFLPAANALLARPDKYLPAPQRAALDTARAAAFRDIDARVWGGRYPGGLADVLANPEGFVARSHNGLSLALGGIGTHLSIVKRGMAGHPALRTLENREAIRAADTAYQSARDLFDEVHLPMKKYDVQKNGVLKDTSKSQRAAAAFKATASGGAKGSLLGLFHKSAQNVSITNEAGQVVLSGEVQYLFVTHHPNPGRCGHFIQLTLMAQGGAPLLGTAMNKAIQQAVRKVNGEIPKEAEKFDAGEVMRQLQGLQLDITDGTSVDIKLRRPLGVKTLDLQYVRGMFRKNSGLNAAVPIPTPVGEFTPGVTSTDSTQGFSFELMGPDLNYQLMQYPRLAEVMDAAGRGGPAALAREFDARPRVKMAYFGGPDVIAETVARYLAFRAEAAANGGRAPGPLRNEFARYYGEAPYTRVAAISREVKGHAPGASAGGADPFARIASLADGIAPLPSGFDLAAAQAHLRTLKTADARMRYYCGAGRPLLDAFSELMVNTRELNRSSMFHTDHRHYGYRTHVGDKKLLERARRAAAAANGESPASLRDKARALLKPKAAVARQLPLSDLEVLAGHPNAHPAVRKELLRREKTMARMPQSTPASRLREAMQRSPQDDTAVDADRLGRTASPFSAPVFGGANYAFHRLAQPIVPPGTGATE